MKYAWTENDTIRDVCLGNPIECYHPDVAIHYITQVPDAAQNGWIKSGSTWIVPPVPEPTPAPTPEPVYPSLSPIQFKLLFTSAERIAIKAARATDPVIEDIYEILDDPRLTAVDLALQSNRDIVGYLAVQGLIAPERVAEILTGVFK